MRIALPKGRLLEGVLEKFRTMGIVFHFESDRDYRPSVNDSRFEAKLMKVRAVPQLVA